MCFIHSILEVGTNQASLKARVELVRKSLAWIGSNGSSNQTKPPSHARLKKQTKLKLGQYQLGTARDRFDLARFDLARRL